MLTNNEIRRANDFAQQWGILGVTHRALSLWLRERNVAQLKAMSRLVRNLHHELSWETCGFFREENGRWEFSTDKLAIVARDEDQRELAKFAAQSTNLIHKVVIGRSGISGVKCLRIQVEAGAWVRSDANQLNPFTGRFIAYPSVSWD